MGKKKILETTVREFSKFEENHKHADTKQSTSPKQKKKRNHQQSIKTVKFSKTNDKQNIFNAARETKATLKGGFSVET